ncbi:DoxX family protein [Phytohabitans suffuscus]|uniref:DoxX family protein n=1 Tax=Phytohabitans suffuscus TaxID=624315 RepID=A0A6F8YUD1_9ACTN|nr:DoxX family protein [Phytohabitans suffuscus]BCB89785.1 hypothetical protein Psuf_070980 [Phytohabitans suffuscus]
MNVALWIVAGLLAAIFLLAGLVKATTPKEKLAANMGWVEDFGPGTVKLIGTLEALGAIGLILPALTDIAPVLVPVAATGLAVTMALAIAVHVRRKEPQLIVANLVLLAAAAFVAWGRFGPHAF